MRALYFEGKNLRLVERSVPLAPPGEALIRVGLAGICATDLEVLKGYMTFLGVPGHEFVGEVVEAPKGGWVGHRVVGAINCSCRVCPLCKGGLANHCPNRTVLGIQGRDGAFAEYLTLPLENLFEVPEEIPSEKAVFVEPLASCFRILEEVTVASGMTMVVLGDGKLGLLAAQVLGLAGIKPIVVGHHTRKMEILKRRGFDVRSPGEVKPQSADLVVDCTGRPEGLTHAFRILRPCGTLVLKSTFASPEPLNLTPLVVNEIRLIGSRCGPYTPALLALKDGSIHVESLIDGIYTLENYEIAFDCARDPETLKILLTLH